MQRCGSKLILAGLCQYLQKRKDAKSLRNLVAPDGSVHCVFLCCDLPYQYISEYFQKLEPESFYPIQNEVRTVKLSYSLH